MGTVQTSNWRSAPAFSIPASRQVFCIGDVHGQADCLEGILSRIASTPAVPGCFREVVYLGDIIDQGPDNIRSIELVLSTREITRADRVTVLPGNHELMLLDGIDEPEIMLAPWIDCGGSALLREIEPESSPVQGGEWSREILKTLLQGLPAGFMTAIRSAPSHYRIGDLLFVHAGLHPHVEPSEFLARPGSFVTDQNHWAWIRRPFLEHMSGWGGALVIHGHTPVQADHGTDPVPLMDLSSRFSRICLDAGAGSLPRVAAAEFGSGDEGILRYRFLVASN